MYLYVVVFLFVIESILSANLSKISQQRIKYIIQHPGTTYEMRDTINTILFNSYKDWASTRAIHFKNARVKICYNIDTNEMIDYALIGLYKGISRFNGNNTFINYVDFYIKCELQKSVIDLLPNNVLPKTYFKKKRTYEEYKHFYNIHLKPLYVGTDNYLIENTKENDIYHNKNKWLTNEDEFLCQNTIWKKIRTFPPFQIKLMYCKYSHDFKRLRTNKEIAVIMDCPIHTINMNLIDIKQKLLPCITNFTYHNTDYH